MRVNEQVDALTTMSIDPWHYLIAPRVLAALIALPVLVVVANVIGIGGGYLIAVFQLDFDGTVFDNYSGLYPTPGLGTQFDKSNHFRGYCGPVWLLYGLQR